ncbi:MAG: FtsQ-type POTRA domain-containing protein [Verrucomicrobiota bacterium]
MPARLTIPAKTLKASPVPRAPSEVAPASAGKKRRKVGGMTLDVNLKVDSPKIREMERAALKRQGFKWAMGLILFICLGALLKITVREAFLKNPQFSLKQVVVRTEGPVTAERIVRTSAITHGMNLLTVNMREIQGRIMTLPAVRSVKITRDYEGRLTIVVKQRQPVAWIELPKLGMKSRQAEIGHFIDAEGVTFPCEVVTEAYDALPVIRHETLAHNASGQAMTDLSIKSALKLLAELQQREEKQGMLKLHQIDIHKPWSLTAVMGSLDPKKRTQMIFGVDDLDDQFTRLDRIWLEAVHREWKIDTLNLLVQKNLPIIFREPPNLEGLQDPVTAAVSTHPSSPAAPTSVR